MNLIALSHNVIIRPDAENASSQLVIPQIARKVSNRGTVIAVGGGRRHIDGTVYPLPVQVGQRVMFSILRAFPLDLDGERLMVMDVEDILCVMAADVVLASN